MKDHKGCLVFLVIITGKEQKEALLPALFESGIRIMTTTYGHGTVSASFLMSSFGLVPEEKKVVINCVTTAETADVVLDMLATKFHFNEPNTGVAYTTRIDKVSF